MKNRLLIALIYFSPISLVAQEIISSNGDYNNVSNGSVSWTIGEPIITTGIISNGIVTQGFQQNYEDFLVDIHVISKDEWVIYPNPFTDEINISEEISGAILIYDLDGKEIIDIQIEVLNGQTKIELPNISAGVYILRYHTENHTIIKKIIKSNN